MALRSATRGMACRTERDHSSHALVMGAYAPRYALKSLTSTTRGAAVVTHASRSASIFQAAAQPARTRATVRGMRVVPQASSQVTLPHGESGIDKTKHSIKELKAERRPTGTDRPTDGGPDRPTLLPPDPTDRRRPDRPTDYRTA
eukprot:gene10020-7907_t